MTPDERYLEEIVHKHNQTYRPSPLEWCAPIILSFAAGFLLGIYI